MDTHIDWLSWTEPIKLEPRSAQELYDLCFRKARDRNEQVVATTFDGQNFDQSASRPPYRICVEREDRGCRLFGNSNTATCLYELTGRGTDTLHRFEDAQSMCAAVGDRVTRIDIATDILTEVRPVEFADARTGRAFRSVSVIQSDSGETVYIGSPKSDRFCRIYRYNPPHPRAEYLRVEYVFRRDLARVATRSLCHAQSQSELAASLGNTFGFVHPVWQPGVISAEKVKGHTTTRKDEDTLMWLYKQVVPAMRRLLETGALDMTDFLTHVYQTSEGLPVPE